MVHSTFSFLLVGSTLSREIPNEVKRVKIQSLFHMIIKHGLYNQGQKKPTPTCGNEIEMFIFFIMDFSAYV